MVQMNEPKEPLLPIREVTSMTITSGIQDTNSIKNILLRKIETSKSLKIYLFY